MTPRPCPRPRARLRTAIFASLLLLLQGGAAQAGVPEAVKAILAGDFTLAESELRPVAEGGDIRAQVLLGRVQRDARNPSRNLPEAYAWFRKAAQGGNAEAQYWAGRMLHSGEGAAKDVVQAIGSWRLAAENGYTPAMGILASTYANGAGVEKDMAESIRWARLGAQKNEMVSLAILGRAHLTGEGGVPQDVGLFVALTRRAAALGERNAQFAVGRLYLDGTGVPQDYVQAHLWSNLAASRGVAAAPKQRDEIAAKMTPQQIAEAQKLASAWRPARAEPSPAASAAAPPASGAASRRTGMGSGFVVDGGGHIITNQHVVRGCGEVRIPAHNVVARVLATDERNDLALLSSSVAIDDLPSFRVSTNARLGEAIVVAGYPLGQVLSGGLNVTTGAVSALAGPGNNAAMLQITAPVQGGNSGGPVLDQSGLVIGVVVSKLNALRVAAATGDVPQNVNFAVNGMVARAFLEANGVQVDSGMTMPARQTIPDVAERAKRYTVLVECWR
jgi:TPR repeat protein